jgi:Tfp pilus assembly protein PilZ
MDIRHEECFDLSLGGMFITTMLPLEVGEIIDVELSLDPVPLRVPARVIWARTSEKGVDEPVGMGLEFIDLTPNQKRLILRQISDHARRGGALKVGDPPTSDPDRASAPARSSARTNRSSSAGRTGGPSAVFWLVVAGAAVAVASLLLTLFF